MENESEKENGMEDRWKGGDIRSIVARQLSTGRRPVSKIKARTIIDGQRGDVEGIPQLPFAVTWSLETTYQPRSTRRSTIVIATIARLLLDTNDGAELQPSCWQQYVIVLQASATERSNGHFNLKFSHFIDLYYLTSDCFVTKERFRTDVFSSHLLLCIYFCIFMQCTYISCIFSKI